MDSEPSGPWITADGPQADVVISCRARLARNIAGFPFTHHATLEQRRELLRIAQDALLDVPLEPCLTWLDLARTKPHERRLLVERHLISKNHADADFPRGVAYDSDEALSVMVNEEDHLRMQVLASGLQLDAVHRRVEALDDLLEERLDYSFGKRWGYLTACPTNVGTGIRFSVMMHLPALKITNEIERVRRSARDMHLAVRGFYGEGSESTGDFYQISNQVTLGCTETSLREELEHRILPSIIEYEHQSRRLLVERNATLLDDRIHRALGILRAARLLGADEAMKLISRVRLGVHLGRLPELDPSAINRLFVRIQPAHLEAVTDRGLTAEEFRRVRADIVREHLS